MCHIFNCLGSPECPPGGTIGHSKLSMVGAMHFIINRIGYTILLKKCSMVLHQVEVRPV